MKKREFLQIVGTTAVVMAATPMLTAQEKTVEAPKEEEWKNEPENKHTPVVKVTREGEVATVTIDVSKHPQSAEHYIDGVELRDEKKAKIFTATILPVTGVSVVVCQLKLAAGTKLTALSHCNKHGIYQAPVTL